MHNHSYSVKCWIHIQTWFSKIQSFSFRFINSGLTSFERGTQQSHISPEWFKEKKTFYHTFFPNDFSKLFLPFPCPTNVEIQQKKLYFKGKIILVVVGLVERINSQMFHIS